MASCWVHVLVCLSATIAMTLSHALPTQDTLVITKSDDAHPTSTESMTDLTTEEPDQPIKLTEMDVRSEITMRYAHTAIVTKVQNNAKRPQEANFRVLLPETAFISGFVMILDGKPYKAYVKEKEEAKNIYKEAVSQGYGAAHISAKARDSNIFTVSVNVEPKTVAVFNLTYEELLTRRNGVYNHAVNLHPGALVPKLTVVVHIKETQSITTLRVPEVRTGNEIDATEEDAENKNAVIVRDAKNREATITFTPDLEEQRQLIQIYKEKSRERRVGRYGYDDNESAHDGILGQFVVQYDVDRSKGSDILVNDGYFVHFFAPTSLPPLSKHVVFVLDISGSMSGRKIEQLIAAMDTILSKLNDGDVFNIVQFESSVQVLDIKSASEESKPPVRDYYYYRENADKMPTLLAPVEATPENIAKAKLLVSRLQAGGGTNIATALDVAIALIQKGASATNSTTEGGESQTTTTEAAANAETKENSDNIQAEKDKTKDAKKDDEKEPIVIFLTDGEPTVGEENPTRIIRVIAEKNYGPKKASIYSLAFGGDADRTFLRKLSLKNDGFMRHIYEASDASLQLRDFYRQISSPLLADVKFVYPPEQVKEGSLTKSKFRRFYAGSEEIVAGRIEDNVGELAPHIYGICGVGLDDGGRKRYDVSEKVPVESGRNSYLPLERLWAYLTIQQLLDESQISDLKADDPSNPTKKALKLALKYEFVTSLTSLVVVKPNATSAVDAESVDKESDSPYTTAMLNFAAPGAPLRPAYSVSDGLSFVDRISFSSSFNRGPSGGYPIALSGMPSLSSGHLASQSSPLFDTVENEVRSLYSRKSWRLGPKIDYYDVMPVTSTAPPPSTTQSPLAKYGLDDFPWTKDLFNSSSDCLTLQINGTQVDLKLAEGDHAFVEKECSKAIGDTAGSCVYLTRCNAALNITAEIYSQTYCVLNDGYAGVCCPQNQVDKKP